MEYYPDTEPNIIDELFLSLTLMRQIFKIIYGIIENQQKNGPDRFYHECNWSEVWRHKQKAISHNISENQRKILINEKDQTSMK